MGAGTSAVDSVHVCQVLPPQTKPYSEAFNQFNTMIKPKRLLKIFVFDVFLSEKDCRMSALVRELFLCFVKIKKGVETVT